MGYVQTRICQTRLFNCPTGLHAHFPVQIDLFFEESSNIQTYIVVPFLSDYGQMLKTHLQAHL